MANNKNEQNNIVDPEAKNNVNTTNDAKQSNINEQDNEQKKIENKKQDDNKNKKEKTYIVHTPVENYVGEIAGVHFAYGKAEVKEGWILNWFKEKGYKVEEKE